MYFIFYLRASVEIKRRFRILPGILHPATPCSGPAWARSAAASPAPRVSTPWDWPPLDQAAQPPSPFPWHCRSLPSIARAAAVTSLWLAFGRWPSRPTTSKNRASRANRRPSSCTRHSPTSWPPDGAESVRRPLAETEATAVRTRPLSDLDWMAGSGIAQSGRSPARHRGRNQLPRSGRWQTTVRRASQVFWTRRPWDPRPSRGRTRCQFLRTAHRPPLTTRLW